MNLRMSIHHTLARPGGYPGGWIAAVARSLRWRALALVGVAVLAVATVESCGATRNPDGSYTYAFAPDMTITAWGLEDALSQLQNLLHDCLAGTWQRACTRDEMNRIERMHARVLKQKGLLNQD